MRQKENPPKEHFILKPQTTKDLLPSSTRSLLTRKDNVAAKTGRTNGRTSRNPSQPNLTSNTHEKIRRAPRTPLPSEPTPQNYKWLVRRLYHNRPMSHHSGAFSELKLKLDSARHMTGGKPRYILRRMRRIINREVKSSCPDRYHITVGQNSSMKGKELRDTERGMWRMSGIGGPDGQGLSSVADLEEHKDRENYLRWKESIRCRVKGT
ncbi:hypothetical protein sscle_04g034660 [Sclerotinia sclerotiorum 1980 UF-70]|uniref:Uncharacterized protein n=1 Tax=Sclerotinia sclerotiorum (strain ATCC 18683 / 1980 / Ss-1) TaxID=665079 RepID=A0A1D9Q1A8_SCLS1|nr:hypothetical protein sscle_04g034660 [Sclerotinia sclerotiorum 1980 UF-70]